VREGVPSGPDGGPVLTVTTVNVNGVRAASVKGLTAWLADTAADVVCLQEVRAEEQEYPVPLREQIDRGGWHLVHEPCRAARGRSGVAVLSRTAPQAVRTGIGVAEFDGSGRYVEIDLPGLTVGSLYLPKGAAGTPKQEEKDRFLTGFATYLAERPEKAAAEDREVLVCGDWNIAHTELDIRNHRGNVRNSGFLPHEREWLGELFADGYVDVVRALHPGVEGPYSWWSYRGRAFDNDTGWRIDHHVATVGLAGRARSAVVERAAAHALRWSDHAPVTVVYGGPG
jgi:exodeoxyribonuclease III